MSTLFSHELSPFILSFMHVFPFFLSIKYLAIYKCLGKHLYMWFHIKSAVYICYTLQ